MKSGALVLVLGVALGCTSADSPSDASSPASRLLPQPAPVPELDAGAADASPPPAECRQPLGTTCCLCATPAGDTCCVNVGR